MQQPYAAARFVRVAGPDARMPRTSIRRCSPDGPFRSSIRRTTVRPGRCRRRPAPTRSARPIYGDQIRAEIEAGGPDRFVLDRTFQTQSIDQVFLEPEAGLAWYDSGTAQARARDRRAVAARRPPAASPRSLSKNAAAQAVDRDRRALRRVGRRLRRQGPHHLSALRRAGRAVLAGPSGASRQRPLRPVPVRHQASCR